MSKRFIARLLVFLQVYSSIFQGIAHGATLVEEGFRHSRIGQQHEHHFREPDPAPVNHISSFSWIYSHLDENGSLSLALGNGRNKPQIFPVPSVDNPYEEWEYAGVGVNRSGVYFNLQGLNVSINKSGIMVIESLQSSRYPLFIGSNSPMILKGVQALALQIMAPRVFAVGKSHVGSVRAEECTVIGKLIAEGNLESQKLTLKEDACLEHRGYVPSTIRLLDSQAGHLTNHGILHIAEIAKDSTFSSVLNRHVVDIEKGHIHTDRFENTGTWIAEQSYLSAVDGVNQGRIKLLELAVNKQWTNHPSSTLLLFVLAGEGELENEGTIQSGSLQIHLKKLINRGKLLAKEVILSASVHPLINEESGELEADHLLSKRKILNEGVFTTHQSTLLEEDFLLSSQGSATLRSLKLISGKITNEGELLIERVQTPWYLNLLNQGHATIDGTRENIHENSLRPHYSTAYTDPEFAPSLNTIQIKIKGTYYKNLVEATSETSPIDPIFNALNSTQAKSKAFAYKQRFLDLARKKSLQEQEALLQQAQSQITPQHYQQQKLFEEETQELDQKIAKIQSQTELKMVTGALTYTDPIDRGDGWILGWNTPALVPKLKPYLEGLSIDEQLKVLDKFIANPSSANIARILTNYGNGRYAPMIYESLKNGLEGYKQALIHYQTEYQNLLHQRATLVPPQSLVLIKEAERQQRFITEYKARLPEISQLTLTGSNTMRGTLHLKRGQFNLDQLTNQGMLVQERSTMNGLKDQGQWHSLGSLRLEGYTGYALPPLEVEGDLIVKTPSMDGLKALESLLAVKASKVVVDAPSVKTTSTTQERPKKHYPWPLVFNLQYGMDNAIDIEAPELTLHALYLNTTGNLFTPGNLTLNLRENAHIDAHLAGRKGVTVEAKSLEITGKQSIPGANAPHLLFKRNDHGIYSQGLVNLISRDVIDNQFGVIQGASYQITTPKFINTAGLITSTNPAIDCLIDVSSFMNTREAQGSYGGTQTVCGIYYAGGKDWCPHGNRPFRCGCNGLKSVPVTLTHETSDEGVIMAQGNLELRYDTLDMIASRITSGGTLTLRAQGKEFVHNDPAVLQMKDLPGTTTMTIRNGHANHLVAKQDLNADLGNADIGTSIAGQNIFISAAQLTLQSLGLQKKSQGKVVNLLGLMQESQSSGLFKQVKGNKGETYHDLSLPFKSAVLPGSLVLLGKDTQDYLSSKPVLDQEMTMRALHQAMGSSFFTLYRGINGLGLDINSFFEATSAFVRIHKDTVTTKKVVKWGDQEVEMEVDMNPTLTEKDFEASGVVGIFQQFAQNAHSLESKQKALDDISQTRKKAEMLFVLPQNTQTQPGVHSPGDVALISKDDLGVFTNVKGKNVALVSTQGSTTIGSTVIREQLGANFREILVKTKIEADDDLTIGAESDLINQAPDTHSGKQTNMFSKNGAVFDLSVPTVSYTETHHYSKKESTTTKVTHIHQNVSSHTSGNNEHKGVVNITAHTGIHLQGTKLKNANLNAPVIIQEDVHDQTFGESQTIKHKKKSGFGGWFGGSSTKTTNHTSSTSTSIGCYTSGESFIAKAKELFKAINPRFASKTSEIEAGEALIKVGVDTYHDHTQALSQGPIWNKQTVSRTSHTTHQNPTFEHNVYLHSDKVILEKVRGSNTTFDNIISDTPPQIVEVTDVHHSTTKSQKSLSTGAALLTKLAVGLALWNPVTFGLSGTAGTMASAGFGSLCGDAATALIENDGDPGRAMRTLSKNGAGLNVVRAMLSAGLVAEISDITGVKTAPTFDQSGKLVERTLTEYAQKAAIQSAVNTVLAVSIDGQKFEDAMQQGMASVALNTLASWGAGQIGSLYSQEAVGYGAHKALHGLTGAGLGAGLAAISHTDPRIGATSGAFGAIISEMIAEGFKPEMVDVNQYTQDHPEIPPQEVLTYFMEEAQKTASWSAFATTATALGLGFDPVTSHTTARNAVDHNFLQTIPIILCASILMEYPQYLRNLETDEPHVALGKMGIGTIEGTTVGIGVGCVFTVGGMAYRTLREAMAVTVAKNPLLKNACAVLETRLGKIEAYVKDQFNWREHFAAEKLNIKTPWASKYWTQSSEYTFKGQTNTVYKRDDLIDLYFLDIRSGLTNHQLMQKGRAPIGLDGKPINLHHSLQTIDSPLIELTETFHQKYTKIIHINPQSIPSGIDRSIFDAWRTEYWKQRAVELGGV